jgi:hypothetical protein
MRRFLLFEVVAGFLAIEFHEHLARPHAITEIRQQPADASFRFGRDRHLVDGGKRADHFDRAMNGFLTDRFDLDRLGRLVTPARLRRLRFRTAARESGDKD